MNNSNRRIDELFRRRGKSHLVRLSLIAVGIATIWSWTRLNASFTDIFTPRRMANLQRFVEEIYPFGLRDSEFTVFAFSQWWLNVWNEKGAEATLNTLAISVIAIVLSGMTAVSIVFLAARNVASSAPFGISTTDKTVWNFWKWRCVVGAVRLSFIFARAIPEYVWAFLLLAMLGPSPWPAILALALHNYGILGKLGAEVIENVTPSVPQEYYGIGLSRSQIASSILIPMALPKWLLFFFYRWETCVREATVLGMLGIASLGFWVRESRARDWYDEMFAFVLMGAAIVLIGDIISSVARRYVRSA